MKKLKAVLILMLSVCNQNTFGQVMSSDTSTAKTINLDEVVISVNKTEETKKTVAQQIQIMRINEIANLQSQTTADMIANSGNVFVQKSQQGGGSPVIRGFEANRILLVVDGVRLNNIIYRSGHLQNIITLDNAILDRVEVLFGPSSTVYGSDALGGVIHLYTRNPVFAEGSEFRNIRANAFVRYGTVNNENTGHFDFNIGGKNIASLTSFTISKFDDLRGGENQNPFYSSSYGERPYYAQRFEDKDSLVKNSDRYLQVPSGFTQYDILQKLSLRMNDHLSHKLNIQYSTSTDVPRYDRLTDPSGNSLRYAEWYYGPQMRLLTAYDLNYINSTAFFQNVHAGLSYQNIEESRHTRRFNKNNLQHRLEKVNVIGANVDLQRNIHSHNIRLGIDAQYNTLKSTANEEDILSGDHSPLDTRYPDGDNNMSNVALYWSHTWRINNELSLTDGIRLGVVSLHSTFVDTSFFHLPYDAAEQNNIVYSGSLGLINNPSEDVKLSLLLSTGFRVPNVDDLSKVFESSPDAVIVPNSDLKPEKTVTAELGISTIINKRTSWENSVYYTHLTDAIVTAPFQYNGQDSILYLGSMSQVLANQNKQEAYVYGLSSNLKSKCTENLLLTFSVNYTYGRIKTDSSDYPLDHIPPFMMRFQLTYTYNNFNSDLFVNYNGWKKLKDYYMSGEDNEQYATPDGMPAWYTLNFRISYKIHRLITIQAGIDNIFDTQYRTFASGINGPGRNVIACVRFHY